MDLFVPVLATRVPTAMPKHIRSTSAVILLPISLSLSLWSGPRFYDICLILSVRSSAPYRSHSL